ncbi:CopD family protein [Falsirhodobacter halotolerans]|uniref:CopD family protein n=1 Tax=Falsirhodobacter halotolerans TaxID=1146892 RepID=UPI001FD4558C|nr:CopD family protein [Falsirhodobacter halotolerans]MCJ8141294.1 CopD family protein [Falsirhodobacter halotolerans]
MSELLKVVHIAAIAVWCAGLISLPSLYVQRKTLSGPALHRLQRIVRAAYIVLVSPCAFVAVASGTALIFTEQVYQPWFAAKLAFVGALAFLHVLTGLVVIRLFREGETYRPARFVVATGLASVVILSILWLVLAKPVFPGLQDGWFRPGALQEIIAPLNPWARS